MSRSTDSNRPSPSSTSNPSGPSSQSSTSNPSRLSPSLPYSRDNPVVLPAYERICLLLQGGGALGAYHAGVYQGLHEAGIPINELSGISIGALNVAIIAGNPPNKRIERLMEFWETICHPNFGLPPNPYVEHSLSAFSDAMRQAFHGWHALNTVLIGQRGFFEPRIPPPALVAHSSPKTVSYYDTAPLKQTLERLCDFDRINSGEHYVSVAAVNVRTANFTYFDNRRCVLRAEHFMASGALPPAFAAVEIDGEYYWDGGLVSNTPLIRILDSRPMRDTLVFQVDVWSARGKVPTTLSEVNDRIKDIRFSSRTRQVTDRLHQEKYLRRLIQRMANDLPDGSPAKQEYLSAIEALGDDKRYNIIHLIYRNKPYEQYFKDFQFDLPTMRDRWDAGLRDMRRTLQQPHYLDMPDNLSGFVTHDIHREELMARMNSGHDAKRP